MNYNWGVSLRRMLGLFSFFFFSRGVFQMKGKNTLVRGFHINQKGEKVKNLEFILAIQRGRWTTIGVFHWEGCLVHFYFFSRGMFQMKGPLKNTHVRGFHINPTGEKVKSLEFIFLSLKILKTYTKHGKLKKLPFLYLDPLIPNSP